MNSKGDLTEGNVRVTAERQSHDEIIYGADGSTLPVRVELIRREQDTVFQFQVLVEKGGTWTVVFEITYRTVRS